MMMKVKMEQKNMTEEKIDVLDKGYVRLIDVMGSDLSIVNAARASFAKESLELSKADERLINFLVRENHMSPFRHAFMTFEFKAPLLVARQHWKYIVGSDHTMDGWNESSRRYVTQDPEFYIPNSEEWRSTPENRKQGSGPALDASIGSDWTAKLIAYAEQGEALYCEAMEAGIAAEQARLFLPAYGMYVNYRWSCSLQSAMIFLQQRLAEDSQKEIQLYAEAVKKLIIDKFPVTMDLLIGS